MPEIVYNVKFRIKQEQIGSSGVADITAYEREIEKLRNTVNQQAKEITVAAEATEGYNNSLKGFSQTQKNTNKQLAIGNQLFFSLSDGIQDSTQFSQGFAQGMRAVGNNIGFTAELAGSFVQRVREMNGGVLTATGLFKGLAGSLFGVGGVILAINLAVTALTNYSARQEKTAKDTMKLSEETDRLTNALKRLIDEAVAPNEDILDQSFDVEGIARRLDKVVRLTEDYRTTLTRDVRALIEESVGGAVSDDLVNRTVKAFIETGSIAQGYTEELTESQRMRFDAFRELIISGEKQILDAQKNIAKASIAIQSETARQILASTPEVAQADEENKDLEERYKARLKIQEDRRKREQQAQRELSILVAQSTEDEISRAQLVKDARLLILNERIEQELLTESETKLELLKIEQEFQNSIDSIRKKRQAEEEKERKERLRREAEAADAAYQVTLYRIEQQKQVEEQKAQSIVSINQSMISTISSLSSTLEQKNKAVAIALLAVEKGVKVAEVVTSASKEIAKAKMAALSAIALGNIPGSALAFGTIPLIKRAAAASIASILAAGIGQGARILGAGGSEGGGGGAAGSRRVTSQSQVGFTSSERQAPSLMPSRGSQQTVVNLNVTNKLDRRGLALAVQEGRNDISGASVSIRSV